MSPQVKKVLDATPIYRPAYLVLGPIVFICYIALFRATGSALISLAFIFGFMALTEMRNWRHSKEPLTWSLAPAYLAAIFALAAAGGLALLVSFYACAALLILIAPVALYGRTIAQARYRQLHA
jgi:prepilin signal peptidase PulO-like enzyme (type II secretory pathway)